MKRVVSTLLLSAVLFQTNNANAHFIGGTLDCKKWYKDVFTATLCGIGTVLGAPFEILDYLDERSLKNKAGILRKDEGSYNVYTFKKKKDLKLAIVHMESRSLAEAQGRCKQINGTLATPEETSYLYEGIKYDSVLSGAVKYVKRSEDQSSAIVLGTGWVEGIEGKDVYLYNPKTDEITYANSNEIVEELNASEANRIRDNFTYSGILSPVCTLKK